ncbi:hypothetical protein [Lysobacter gummosus]|uniref:hypothetical protein n=1 Tax=Lysobacter gummosus TaxID=262324 RepID=UPI0036442989
MLKSSRLPILLTPSLALSWSLVRRACCGLAVMPMIHVLSALFRVLKTIGPV